MATICLVNRSDSDLTSLLYEALTKRGHTVIRDNLDAKKRVDCLVYLADEVRSPERLSEWLLLANNSESDILVTAAPSYTIPAGMVLMRDLSVTDAIAAEAVLLNVDRSLESIDVGPAIPRLLPLEPGVRTPSVAGHPDALYDQLRKDRARVVAVAPDLLRSMRSRPITGRKAYDLHRFVRWSQERLDGSFVKLGLRMAGAGSDRGPGTRRASSLAEVVADARASNLVVLKGPPGAGKTLQLRFLETYLAISSIQRGSPEDGLMAFWVSLGEHAAAETRSPVEWLAHRWARRVEVERMQTLDVRLSRGNMVLLLDGLNEIPFTTAEDRRRWMLRWKSAIHEDVLSEASNRVVVACRSRDLNIGLGSADVAQTTVEMMPLSQREVIEIAKRRNPGAAAELERAALGDESLLELYRRPFPLTDYLQHAASEVPRSQSEVFCRRVIATLARERERSNFRIFDDRWLPEDVVNRLLDEESVRSAIPVIRIIPLLAALSRLARDLLAINEDRDHSAAFELEEATRRIAGHLGLADENAARDALFVAVDLDLLTTTEGLVRFQHHTLQEFFAALTLNDRDLVTAVTVTIDDFEAKLGVLLEVLRGLSPGDELQILPSTGFEEVFVRALELRPHLIRRLVTTNPWLAAERADSLALEPGVKAALRRDLVRALSGVLSTATDPRQRAATLLSLGQLGWLPARLGISDLVGIPAARWTLGCDDELLTRVGSGSLLRQVQLPEFRLARHPVTNAEFSRFVHAGGYSKERYWSVEGWLWRSGAYPVADVRRRWTVRRDTVAARPHLPLELLRQGKVSISEAAAVIRFGRMSDDEVLRIATSLAGQKVDIPAQWYDNRFSNPLQPVAGVSWYEAQAYCNWLSEECGAVVRLPTEDEWEAAAVYAATYGTGHAITDLQFPREWNLRIGNTGELHLGRTSPVGTFSPAMAAQADVPADLSGNVFEWVVDVFRPHEMWRHVCKGGSWRHLLRRGFCTYRGRGDVTARNDDIGFRIMVDEQVARA